MEQTLFERLADPNPDRGRRTDVDFTRLTESIMRNLRGVLNSRRGGALIAEDYGVPEFSEITSTMPDSLTEFQQNIKETIEKFEPRLTQVRVRPAESEDDQPLLRFEVRALLNLDQERAIMTFETVMDAAGRIDVMD